jgi:GT2 family glycosyltransferase
MHPHQGALVADVTRDDVVEVDWLDGACMLISERAIDRVGLLDERYFLYLEDADYAFRLRQAGLGVACDLGALAWQRTSVTRRVYLVVRNNLHFIARHGSRRRAWRAALGTLVRLPTRQGRLITGLPGERLQRIRALWDFSRHRFGPP